MGNNKGDIHGKKITDFNFSKLGSYQIADVAENFIGGIFDTIRDRCYDEVYQAVDESKLVLMETMHKGKVNFRLEHEDYCFEYHTSKGYDEIATVNICPFEGIDSIVSAYQNTAILDGVSHTSERKLKKMIKFLEGQIERLKSPA